MEVERKNHKRSSLKCNPSNFDYFSNSSQQNPQKKITFDESSLSLKRPSKGLILEPKTPYVEYEGDDDEYLKKIKIINTIDLAVNRQIT